MASLFLTAVLLEPPAVIRSARPAGLQLPASSLAALGPSIRPAPLLVATLAPAALERPAHVPALAHALDLADRPVPASAHVLALVALLQPAKRPVRSVLLPGAVVDARSIPRRRKAQ